MTTDSVALSLNSTGENSELQEIKTEFPVVRSHRASESAKKCRICGKKQKREIVTYGPVHLSECQQKFARGYPKKTHDRNPLMKGPIGWFFGTSDYPAKHEWYVVVEKATCGCFPDESGNPRAHIDKAYRRPFSSFKEISMPIEAALYEFLGSSYLRVKTWDQFAVDWPNGLPPIGSVIA